MDNYVVKQDNNESIIQYDIVELNRKELLEQGYKEIPKDSEGNLLMIMQYLPGAIINGVTKASGNKAVQDLSQNAY
jgi:hypothetical protein